MEVMASQDVYLNKPERKLFLPFIEELLDYNEIEGLHWIDKEQRIFRMPWKHMKRHDYEMGRDSALFRAWAINSGKFKENDQDPSRWKINFRSALNTMKHIFQEIEDKSDEDCRVFRIVQPDAQSRKRKATVPPDRLRTSSLPIKPCPVNASAFYGMTTEPVYSSSYWMESGSGHLSMEPGFAWMPPTPVQETQQWIATNGAFGMKKENGVSTEEQAQLTEDAKSLMEYFRMTEVYASPQHRTFQGFFSVTLNGEVHTAKIQIQVTSDYPHAAPQCEVIGDDDVACRCQAALAECTYLKSWTAESSTLTGLAEAIRGKLADVDLETISTEDVEAVKQERASNGIGGSGFLSPVSQTIATPLSPKAFQPYRRDSGENSPEAEHNGEHSIDEEKKLTDGASTPPPLVDASDDEPASAPLASREGSSSKVNGLEHTEGARSIQKQPTPTKTAKFIPDKQTDPAGYIEYLQGELLKNKRQCEEFHRRVMVQDAQIADMGLHMEELASKYRQEHLQCEEFRSVLAMKRAQLQELETQLACLRRRDRISQRQGYYSYWSSPQFGSAPASSQQQVPPKGSNRVHSTVALASSSRTSETGTSDQNSRTHGNSTKDTQCARNRKSPGTVLIMPHASEQEEDYDEMLYIDENVSSPSNHQNKELNAATAHNGDEVNSLTGTPPPSPDAVDRDADQRRTPEASLDEEDEAHVSVQEERGQLAAKTETHPPAPDTNIEIIVAKNASDEEEGNSDLADTKAACLGNTTNHNSGATGKLLKELLHPAKTEESDD